MIPDLSGKTALVTGGASGLGRGLAIALAKAGADVAIHYHGSEDKSRDAVHIIKELGVRVVAVQADFAVQESVEQCFVEISTKLAAPDILVNNASVYFQKPLSQTTPHEFQENLAVNLTAVHTSCQCVLPAMRKKRWGRIINLGLSTASKVQAYRDIAAHAISKTGLLILTKSLAVEEALNGITVNCISPGLMDNGKLDKATMERHQSLVPMKRMGTPDDLVGALYYFVGPADYVTGTEIVVGGGWGI